MPLLTLPAPATRRGRVLLGAFVVAALLIALAVPARANAAWPTIYLAKRYSGLSSPVFLTGDGTGERVYIVERGGTIRMARTGETSTSVFLDVSAKVDTTSERGLLGLAFPSGYAASGRFYVYYVDAAGMTHISRFVRSAASSDLADPSSETTVMAWPRPNAFHNGGWLQFGPDGMLYASSGDGGPQGDPDGHAQSLSTLLGKIIRIDAESGAATYTVPADNPFVATPGAQPEIWMYGLRNPWRCSFNSAGDLFIGDVGRHAWEEIDYAPAGSKGQNFGWNLYEGAHPYPPGSAAQPSGGLTFPVAEYPHPVGEAVVGGYLYEGTAFPALKDTYFYADYLTGKIWGMRGSGTAWTSQLLLQNTLAYSSFGTDDAKNLFICSWNTGEIYAIRASRPTPCTLSTGSATIRYAAKTAIRGTLTDGGVGVVGMPVQLQWSADAKSWRNAGLPSTTTAGGAFAFSAAPTVKTYYRVRFGTRVVGDVGYAGSMSAVIRLLPQVYLTTPLAPTAVAKGQVFSASSLLKPRHTVGTYPAQLRCYRYESGKWVLRKVVKLRASNYSARYPAYTKVSGSVSLPYRGTWRLIAYHPLDSLNAATISSWRSLRVR